ncbi:MAG: hypothetical protein H7Y03_07780 [Chitinophagaceae bacterium]|nr:hypothetical protein [Chitinophagaceae bacterium]
MKYKNGIQLNGIRDIPLVVALSVMFLIVFILERAVLDNTDFVFMYPLDDPFIHMQIARNLALHGVWGINAQEFASASSSLLYTVLLAAIFKIFLFHAAVPFIINCVAAGWLFIGINNWLRKQQMAAVARTTVLLLLVFFVPMPVMIISGMEHTLQCLFCFLFIVHFSDWLQATDRALPGPATPMPWKIYVLAILVIALRYEGMFLIAAACLLLLYRRKLIPALLLGFTALLPVIVFGVYSLSVGSYFFPNSVLIKSESAPLSLQGLASFLYNIAVNKLTIVKPEMAAVGTPPPGISLLVTQRLLIILPLTALLFIQQLKEPLNYLYILLLLSVCTLFHLSFASTGWFYRYEAYLIVCSLVPIFLLFYKYGKGFVMQWSSLHLRILLAVLLFALFFPFVIRSTAAYSKATRACINIYQQQYQMAAFTKAHYNNSAVAANDIGAVSFFTDASIVDLWGLGSITVAKSRKNKYWTPQFLDSLARVKNVKVAIVYDEWFDPQLLARWKKVATWKIPNNVICGSDTVCFYALDEDSRRLLLQNLKKFETSLPKPVSVSYR